MFDPEQGAARASEGQHVRKGLQRRAGQVSRTRDLSCVIRCASVEIVAGAQRCERGERVRINRPVCHEFKVRQIGSVRPRLGKIGGGACKFS